EARHAFAFDAEAPPGLRPGGDRHLGAFTLDGGDFHFATERGFAHRRGRAAIEVHAVALEQLVRLHREEEVEIARRTAALAAVAVAGGADARAVFAARWIFH